MAIWDGQESRQRKEKPRQINELAPVRSRALGAGCASTQAGPRVRLGRSRRVLRGRTTAFLVSRLAGRLVSRVAVLGKGSRSGSDWAICRRCCHRTASKSRGSRVKERALLVGLQEAAQAGVGHPRRGLHAAIKASMHSCPAQVPTRGPTRERRATPAGPNKGDVLVRQEVPGFTDYRAVIAEPKRPYGRAETTGSRPRRGPLPRS